MPPGPRGAGIRRIELAAGPTSRRCRARPRAPRPRLGRRANRSTPRGDAARRSARRARRRSPDRGRPSPRDSQRAAEAPRAPARRNARAREPCSAQARISGAVVGDRGLRPGRRRPAAPAPGRSGRSRSPSRTRRRRPSSRPWSARQSRAGCRPRRAPSSRADLAALGQQDGAPSTTSWPNGACGAQEGEREESGESLPAASQRIASSRRSTKGGGRPTPELQQARILPLMALPAARRAGTRRGAQVRPHGPRATTARARQRVTRSDAGLRRRARLYVGGRRAGAPPGVGHRGLAVSSTRCASCGDGSDRHRHRRRAALSWGETIRRPHPRRSRRASPAATEPAASMPAVQTAAGVRNRAAALHPPSPHRITTRVSAAPRRPTGPVPPFVQSKYVHPRGLSASGTSRAARPSAPSCTCSATCPWARRRGTAAPRVLRHPAAFLHAAGEVGTVGGSSNVPLRSRRRHHREHPCHGDGQCPARHPLPPSVRGTGN